MGKLFKNYKSKKQLREEIQNLKQENAKLEGMLSAPIFKSQLTVEREAQEVVVRVLLENGMPIEVAKETYTQRLAKKLMPLIEWDVEDRDGNPYWKTLTGRLFLTVKKTTIIS